METEKRLESLEWRTAKKSEAGFWAGVPGQNDGRLQATENSHVAFRSKVCVSQEVQVGTCADKGSIAL